MMMFVTYARICSPLIKKEEDVAKRIFRLRFSFKIQKYDRNHKYYLAAIDDKTNIEVLRREVIMDLAFADDFGF